MKFRRVICAVPLGWALVFGSVTQAASLSASLASESLGVSSGLVSDSVSGVSRGSSKAVGLAQGAWQVMEVAQMEGDPARHTLSLLQVGGGQEVQTKGQTRLQVHLPSSVVREQALEPGAVIAVAERAWGYTLTREPMNTAFFVLIHDEWAPALKARAVVH